MCTTTPHGGIASPGSGGRAPYRDAEPAGHRGPCWAAAIGRHSRGREHDTDYEVIIREALADLVEHPENCRCVRRGVGDVGVGGDRRGRAGRVDAEQVGAALPHDRVLAGGGGPGQFGEQLLAEREPGAFGGDPLDAVGDGAAGDEIGSAGLMEGLGWFAA